MSEQTMYAEWVHELELALGHLKNANEMPSPKGVNIYVKNEVSDAVCSIQDILKEWGNN